MKPLEQLHRNKCNIQVNKTLAQCDALTDRKGTSPQQAASRARKTHSGHIMSQHLANTEAGNPTSPAVPENAKLVRVKRET